MTGQRTLCMDLWGDGFVDEGRPLPQPAPIACPAPASSQQAAIVIDLRPFTLDRSVVGTCIHLDAIALDMDDPRCQAGASHRFPVNPQPGYIDGSIYLYHRHLPLDVTELALLRLRHMVALMALDWRDVATAGECDNVHGHPHHVRDFTQAMETPHQESTAHDRR